MTSPASGGSTAPQAAARALFARVPKKNAQIILPLNASAAAAEAHKPAVYCIHSITGAGGTDFVPLAQHLGEEVRVFGVQAPPERMQDAAFGASVCSLAGHYATVIAEAPPSADLVLAGWSAGAVIALEIAHQLRARGRNVALLVAIDGAPELDRAGLRRWDPRYLLAVLARLPAWWRDTRAMEPRFRASSLRRFRSILVRLRRAALLGGPQPTPGLKGLVDLHRYPPAQQQFMARLGDALKAYAPQAWDGPVIVYEARITPAHRLPQYLARWRCVAPQAEAVVLDGNHFTIMREPRVAALARDLRTRIGGASANAGEGRR
ncbi:thioesterase domain-containing protein [Phenylobacterium sp. LjRoot219]|uniref:thioesterase domain-containing protein n=1 Tax=Phenylobacterium sp. LjRoot219 TaxID=3342283 RepID=UPI003ECD2C09